jgi:hypothetical protein
MKVAGFHLVGYLISGAARLRDHIERIDDGAAYAVDDLAVVLRLLVSGVSGGQLISRTAQSFGIPLPKIGISAEPEPIQGLVWGAGALPTAETLGTGGQGISTSCGSRPLCGFRLGPNAWTSRGTN